MELVQGSSNLRLEVELNEGTENIVENASSIEIQYNYRLYEGDDVSGTWTADGYFMEDSTPVVYYVFKGDDEVQVDAKHLLGRISITDANGRLWNGKRFSINIVPDEL